MPPTPITTLGFIGLGVMGEPACGHLARWTGKPTLAHDPRPEPLERRLRQWFVPGVRRVRVTRPAHPYRFAWKST